MGKVKSLTCVKCGGNYEDINLLTCPQCGLDGILDVQYDYDSIRKSFTRDILSSRKQAGVFRYQELLPVDQPPPGMLRVGWTPLYKSDTLGDLLGLTELYIKDETVNPSGSLKDRASAIAVAIAARLGVGGIACASTGNAASSLAVLSASAGISSFIFVPASIPASKLLQIAACATRVFKVRGTYEDAFDIATWAIGRWGWYNRNCAINPNLVEGKKTCSLEICEQLSYSVPDWLVVQVGDGCILSGQWKAFKELKALGLIERLPRILAVQAEGCQPILKAFREGIDAYEAHPATIADSIRVGKPRNWRKAVKAITESKGYGIDVSDGEILEAINVMARRTGIFVEPAGAAGLAGLKKAVEAGVIERNQKVVIIATGSGLKDPESIKDTLSVTEVGNTDDVERVIGGGH